MCCARPAAGALLRSDLTGYGGFARSGHDLSVKASRAGPDAGRRSTARHAAVGRGAPSAGGRRRGQASPARLKRGPRTVLLMDGVAMASTNRCKDELKMLQLILRYT